MSRNLYQPIIKQIKIIMEISLACKLLIIVRYYVIAKDYANESIRSLFVLTIIPFFLITLAS